MGEGAERRMANIWVKPADGIDGEVLFAKIKETVTSETVKWDDKTKFEDGRLYATFTIDLDVDFDEEVMEVIECMEEHVADQGIVFQTALE